MPALAEAAAEVRHPPGLGRDEGEVAPPRRGVRLAGPTAADHIRIDPGAPFPSNPIDLHPLKPFGDGLPAVIERAGWQRRDTA